MILTQADIARIAKNYSVLNQIKLSRKIKRAERMIVYYDKRIEASADDQKFVLEACRSALYYLKTVAGKYDKLTKEIEELNKGAK